MRLKIRLTLTNSAKCSYIFGYFQSDAIAGGLDLDGSAIPANKLNLYREVMSFEAERQRSGASNIMRSRIVRIRAKHLP